jgi:hypothetical protein
LFLRVVTVIKGFFDLLEELLRVMSERVLKEFEVEFGFFSRERVSCLSSPEFGFCF